ncbi:CLUMA_CG009230, isoform A [Clunio marinus]|uniref:CLUMA_CG009230, isoform A n=1 Tax=Clunio marinus TaxID=568069 RepID=A0A1J1I653_9DIPT|nr:CLUMA_CG009230, isoform A [Clunio marinus]
MKTLTFVLVAIVIAVDARKVCVPVPDQDPCAAIVVAAMPTWKEVAQMLASLNTDCSNELSALSFANGEEFDTFNAEFHTSHHCMTSQFSYQEDLIASLASIVGASVEDYSKYITHQSDRVGDAICLAEGDTSTFTAFTNVADGWNNIIQLKKTSIERRIEHPHDL